MRFRLRTLLIVLALGPPMLAAFVYLALSAWYLSNYRSNENDQKPPPTFHRPSP